MKPITEQLMHLERGETQHKAIFYDGRKIGEVIRHANTGRWAIKFSECGCCEGFPTKREAINALPKGEKS